MIRWVIDTKNNEYNNIVVVSEKVKISKNKKKILYIWKLSSNLKYFTIIVDYNNINN